ncbi:hypothetical protein DFH28DRAFT_922894 [Melampsora americana]|nr:hypothetical protein DFH28DRAFT_922894 [Melampsora americana]
MTKIELNSDSEYNPIKKTSQSQTTKTTIKIIDNPSNPKSKKKSTAYACKDGQGYAWEDEYKQSWDILREHDSVDLATAVNQLMANQCTGYDHSNQSILLVYPTESFEIWLIFKEVSFNIVV